ncbi:TPA: 4-oxalomesaconate tautomerase [Providencia stuartii]|nr:MULTISPECIES: 4-oxalomesaconate tautomerase [Providencia]AIN63214.1 prpF family protein [Providencia stuartii]AMG66351.1 4-oxalomesaconate tautomerase [Providencia stuartii]APG49560.1 isomerase [Providencia stuartii]AVE43021.1 4-oxalomesaconate tautomerase [Providencia stuartii]AVL40648.1 4-oxalomesaconate tautomerase [Providencia stuartii]
MKKIPCMLMRGGTSKGVFLLADDLPKNIQERDELILAIMGSGHALQIDGIGGGSPQTSKVAIISRSPHPDADIDYLFAQVSVTERIVDTAPNCGNILCAVGAYAIEKGLMPITGDETTIRIRNINTNTFVNATVQTPNGHIVYEGDTTIASVPGHAAPIALTFLNACGTKTGKLLPTGHAIDTFDGVEVSCIDMAMPVVLIDAPQLNKTGYESAAQLEADKAFMQRLESIRRQAGLAMGLGDVSQKVIPKPVLVSPAIHGGTVNVRYFMPHKCHGALAVTGAIAIATGTILENSVIKRYLTKNVDMQHISIEHLSGHFDVSLNQQGDFPEGLQASIIRTARKLFSGDVYVP